MFRQNRREAVVETGLIFLAYELLKNFRDIPLVTLIFIIFQCALYIGYIDVPWEKEDVCLSVNALLEDKDWKRLIFSAFEHGEAKHLYFNMTLMISKGRQLEKQYGSKNFFFLLIVLLLLTNGIYVTIAKSMADFAENWRYADACVIGFSGVLFALKVLAAYEWEGQRESVMGINMPVKHSAWLELLLIHILVPNASFMGHLSGILAGVAYCYTFIGTAVDTCIRLITGEALPHRTSDTPENIFADQLYYYREY